MINIKISKNRLVSVHQNSIGFSYHKGRNDMTMKERYSNQHHGRMITMVLAAFVGLSISPFIAMGSVFAAILVSICSFVIFLSTYHSINRS